MVTLKIRKRITRNDKENMKTVQELRAMRLLKEIKQLSVSSPDFSGNINLAR